MSVHFSPASMPVKGIITNLTSCQSHGGKINAHCYFNFHFSKYNETKYKFTCHYLFYKLFFLYSLFIFMGLFIFFPLFCKNYFVICTLLLCNFPIYALDFDAVYDILGMQKYICNAYSHVYLFTYVYLFL